MMDDDMEDEIICELFTAHAHIAWRYIGLIPASLYDLVMPGPGRLLFVAFLLIVASVVLQSSSHLIRHALLRLNSVLGLNSVSTPSFKSLSSLDLVNGVLGSENISWELRDGIVGVYGMQGRRGNMEDRYSVIQNIDVGEKHMSFFGVFDGHGGQYTAEYVKENLFPSTIEKIKQLRSQCPSPKNGNNNNNNNGKTNGNGKVTNGNGKVTNTNGKAETNGKNGDTNGKTLNGRKGSVNEKGTDDVCSQTSAADKSDTTNYQDNNGYCKKESKSPDETTASPGSCVENITPSSPSSITTATTTTTTHTTTTATTPPTTEPEVSQKKDDHYCNINVKKHRNSITSNTVSSSSSTANKEESECNSSDTVYIDNCKNLNYTRLLTDQMMAVDKHVVQDCKSRTDMSGTTALVALLDGELLIIGNVGDSRAVMGDLKGSTIPLSFDHKPNQLKERRRIKEAGGFITFTGVWRVAGILATSRALGDFMLKEPRKLITAEPDVLTFSLRDHKAHFVILATDGLWDVLTNEEAVAFVRDHIHEPDNGAKSLSLEAYHRGSQDNITVAILNIDKLGL